MSASEGLFKVCAFILDVFSSLSLAYDHDVAALRDLCETAVKFASTVLKRYLHRNSATLLIPRANYKKIPVCPGSTLKFMAAFMMSCLGMIRSPFLYKNVEDCSQHLSRHVTRIMHSFISVISSVL
jgi:hypothetical protein